MGSLGCKFRGDPMSIAHRTTQLPVTGDEHLAFWQSMVQNKRSPQIMSVKGRDDAMFLGGKKKT